MFTIPERPKKKPSLAFDHTDSNMCETWRLEEWPPIVPGERPKVYKAEAQRHKSLDRASMAEGLEPGRKGKTSTIELCAWWGAIMAFDGATG